MKINKNLKLVLRDIYSYDISACHYNILKKYGFDLSDINKDDKITRNIQIGQMMKSNPKITSLLRNTTNSLIDDYINKNGIEEDDIVIRQYDGMIITKILTITDIGGMPLDLRHHFEIFISSINRQMYIASASNGDIKIKGVPHRYDEMNEIYRKICKINFLAKESIFRNLQKIKDQFINSNNPYLFGVPVSDEKVNVFLKEYGELEISKNTLKIIDIKDIDKEKYFSAYIEPFTKSIIFEFVR